MNPVYKFKNPQAGEEQERYVLVSKIQDFFGRCDYHEVALMPDFRIRPIIKLNPSDLVLCES